MQFQSINVFKKETFYDLKHFKHFNVFEYITRKAAADVY